MQNNGYVIISDCINRKNDEGCIKITNLLVKEIKKKYDTTVVRYNNDEESSLTNLKLNNLFLNKKLMTLIRKENKNIIYIPFASNTIGSIIRTINLSLMSSKKVYVLFALKHKMNFFSKLLLKMCNATIIALSYESYDFYKKITNKAIYLKTGVDTNIFKTVSKETKKTIREKYNISEDDKVVIHVGHLKSGRNIESLLLINKNYKVILVVSSTTKKDNKLEKILKHNNIIIIDKYVENIEELYQMSDVYFFPVIEEENCIDIPVSVLEAAACNLPIVTTRYGELKTFVDRSGFYLIDAFNDESINRVINQAYKEKGNSREVALEYDMNNSIDIILSNGE